MKGMVGMMLAAMLSATLSNVSGILNVYANVYTYDIWGHKEKNRQADEKKRIKVGRLFTFVFGLVIIALSMLIPFAGGADQTSIIARISTGSKQPATDSIRLGLITEAGIMTRAIIPTSQVRIIAEISLVGT